jgi:serine/threonine-protein kinase 11
MIGGARHILLDPSQGLNGPSSPHRGTIRQLNQYRLDAHLGKGSSGGVFLATDSDNGNRFAVKRIRLKALSHVSSGIAQLERKIRLMQTLTHPNILSVRELLYVESVQEAFLVLDYAENGYLNSYVQRGIRITVPSVLSIIKQVLNAMNYLHQKGLVPQNINPSSLLVNASGRVIMADLGVGHSFQSAGTIVESPAFQAPEAIDDWEADDLGDDDAPEREDVWALGVTFYQLLFLRLPFSGETIGEIVANAKANPLEIPGSIDPAIVALLQGMLKVNPAERLGIEDLIANPVIQNAKDLADDLPTISTAKTIEGTVVALQANVCPIGYSFAGGPITDDAI